MACDGRANPLSAVELVPYRPEWPREFQAIAAEIGSLLPAGAVIDHIGSTAVPGLAAKDVIDVQVQVDELDAPALPGFEPPVRGADHRPAADDGPESAWEKILLVRLEPRRVHVHVRRRGARNAEYALLFRDFLRANAEARLRWEAVKHRLAAESADRAAYVEAKDALTDVLIVEATLWRDALPAGGAELEAAAGLDDDAPHAVA